MIGLLITIFLLGLIFYVLCELISSIIGVIFLLVAGTIILKIGKDIFNK